MSINQYWPGIVAKLANGIIIITSTLQVRAGFLKYQIDFAWYYIYTLYKISGIQILS